jgi:hypothetical protein
MHFTAFGTPAPFLGAQVNAGKFQFGRAVALLTYELEILGPPGSVPILIEVSGRVSGHTDVFGSGTLLLQSNWGIEDVVLGPVFSDRIDSGVQHDDFAQSFSAPQLDVATTAAAIDPCRRTSLMTRRWFEWPCSTGVPSSVAGQR